MMVFQRPQKSIFMQVKYRHFFLLQLPFVPLLNRINSTIFICQFFRVNLSFQIYYILTEFFIICLFIFTSFDDSYLSVVL